MVGCAIRVADGAECLIVVGDDNILSGVGVYDSKIVLRHELGHCNGWSGDHAGARPLAEYN